MNSYWISKWIINKNKVVIITHKLNSLMNEINSKPKKNYDDVAI